jgi:hypothetical protein
MRRLLPFILISMLSLYALLAWAHEAPLDDLGCHVDPITESYHCHKGQLEGREFVSRLEAEDALAATAEQKAEDKADEQSLSAGSSESSVLKVLSWNVNKVGTERFEYDRIANILSEADIIALQEVEFTKSGETSLTVISGLVARKLNEKICKAWFKTAGGDRARHAFLWRETRVGFVEKGGEIRETCTEAPQVIPLDGKKADPALPYFATFFHKSQKRMFVMASVHWDKKPKKPAKEIPAVFKKLEGLPWPTVLAGNLKVSLKDKAFHDVKKLNYKPAFGPVRKNLAENVWTKNLWIVRSEAIDLYERYPELEKKEVDKTVAGSFPVAAELSFEETADALKTEMVKKPSRDKSSVEDKKAPEPPAESAEPPKATTGQAPDNLHDDLEAETQEAE